MLNKSLTALLLISICSFAFAEQKSLETFLFSSADPGVRTQAFVVSKDNKIIYKKFKHGNESTRHLLWSMSKSISSLIFGIIESEGYISRDDKLEKFFPDIIKNLPKKYSKKTSQIRLKDLLGMASGFDWNEYYEEAPFSSDVVRMLYFESQKGVVPYVLKSPPRYDAGTRFHYSSGDTNLLMGAIRKSLPAKLKDSYPWHFFFNPLKMQASFERDGKGVFLGSSYVYLNTSDLLKLGQLIMNNGRYKDKQIVPKSYVEFALDLNEPMKKHGRCLKDHYMTYGAQFWLNHACPSGDRPFKDAPSNLVMLLGHGGQSVFIFPDEKIIAVRIANDDEKALNKNTYSKLILEAYAK